METIKDRNKNPGYSRFTQQLFLSQLSDHDFSVFQEKMFRFPGIYVQRRSIRQYQYALAAHVLGDVAEVSTADIEEDDYYQPGDYIGKLGVERSYEKQLRGVKGMQILLRDAHGRVQGRYQNGKFDVRPVAGKNLTLSLDVELQKLGERLMEGKIGSIVAIDPATGRPRVIEVKWLRIVLFALLGLVACLWLVSFVLTLVNSTGWIDLMRVLNYVPLFIASVTFILGLLHQKGKVTISRSLLIILTAVAIILSASVVAISTLMDFTELAKGGNLLSTALVSFLGLMFHKTRK